MSVNQITPQSDNQKLVDAVNTFGVSLYKELIRKNDNFICSGFSVNTVLSIVFAGAASTTETELRHVLGYDAVGLTKSQVLDAYHQIMVKEKGKNHGFELDVFNAMWIQENFNVKPEFKKTVEDVFFAQVQEVHFQSPEAINVINSLVCEETKGKILKLFDRPLDTSTVMVLTNAIYFKGTWLTKFDSKRTVDLDFYYNDGNLKKKTPMMNVVSKFPYVENLELNVQVLELPYDGNDVSMFVFLPTSVNGLTSFQQNLTWSSMKEAMDGLSIQKVHVKLPKFHLLSSLSLNDILQNLGLKSVFDPVKSDLSGIDGKRDLFVSMVVQKAIIEVNEEGTVAAAATGAGVANAAHAESPPENIYFTADHPFLYLIMHKPTGLNLFSGQFMKP